METVRERAHELKGMAANFGLTGVSSVAGDVEAHAKAGESENAFEALNNLATVNQKAQAALKDWINSQQED